MVISLNPILQAKAGTQIQPERLVGFTWASAFAGETMKGKADAAEAGN
jgi:hypothetical protein